MILQGTTQTYELDGLGLNARCRVEDLTGRPFDAVLRELAGKRRPQPATVRAFLSALLLQPATAPDQIDPVLKDIGGVAVIRRAAQASWRAHRAHVKAIKG